jgi:hypothetical protein
MNTIHQNPPSIKRRLESLRATLGYQLAISPRMAGVRP